ncbi:MAG TPA: serine/threonine-protein kinase, partial [Dongiaceae bacterium]|nr:serine/threonine-protein kinase [Dongiaceae bacterium]
MTLPSRLGAYPIERELGRGGMGIVYLGRDPRLGRAVAIKVLPETLAQDPERLARFDREARLLASLNHPNIAGIYGLEEADGVKFLLLEYVEGETLAERLARGPLPIDEALDVCRQIAAALESAHENGIIHRDLKPGNVKLTPSGDVKVLDFGLAKGDPGSDSASNLSLTHSPTQALTGTNAGIILGTAAYMSPEQARGKTLDRRTDIWSFGCVLFECLSGKQAFAGETISDIIATILQGEPPWHQLPARTPPGILTLLRRCLEKDARKRLRDLGDARLEIEHVLASPRDSSSIVVMPVRRTGSVLRYLPWAIALVFTAAAAELLLFKTTTPPSRAPLLRLSVISPLRVADADAVYLALSPDGTRVTFAADDSTGHRSLWLM